ncbi:MAG: arginine--tRNA ligase [Pseudomonadota bacterium]
MISIFEDFKARVLGAVEALQLEGTLPRMLDASRVTLELPRDPKHGDFSTNAAMVLAKPAGQKPRDVAANLVAELEKDPEIAAIEIAGPGFINMTLDPSAWRSHLAAIRKAGEKFAGADIGKGEKLNVEYVSANPTGPLHVGHCRGAVVGDALAAILAYTGHRVTRESYINDAGAQVDVLARSAYLRYCEALGLDIGPIPEGLYPGDYLKSVGETLAKKHGKALLTDDEADEAEWLPTVRNAAIQGMMSLIQDDLQVLGIDFEVWFSERSMVTADMDRVQAAIDRLKELDLVYFGRLEPPKGQPIEDWEDREQLLFRSSQFGDDTDRPLLKSDGSYTYFAADIAYHHDKFLRGFNAMIDVWGADHGGYVKRMKSAVEAVSEGKATLDVELCQIVRLFRDGQPVRMSKRAGDFVTLRDVVDEVGSDPVRFMMLYRKSDAPLDFDFAKVTEQSKDNPVFYVQYAHARCHSVFRQSAEAFGEKVDTSDVDLSQLEDPSEIELIKSVASFAQVVRAAATHREPHRIAFYLYDLASLFHALWNRGKDAPQLRFINVGNAELTKARLALIEAVAMTLSTGLRLLGVRAPTAM